MTKFTTRKGGRASSPLSQTRIALAPTYLAPFSARWVAEERTLEDGSLVFSLGARELPFTNRNFLMTFSLPKAACTAGVNASSGRCRCMFD